MEAWKRWVRAGKRLLQGEDAGATTPVAAPRTGPTAAPPGGALDDTSTRRGLSGWVEDRAKSVVSQAYESHAGDLEERATRVMSSVYERTADDMEQRAVRAMRSSIEAEAERIKEAIEHGIAVKKREVRLSLLVLVVSSLIYLALYWFTRTPAAP